MDRNRSLPWTQLYILLVLSAIATAVFAADQLTPLGDGLTPTTATNYPHDLQETGHSEMSTIQDKATSAKDEQSSEMSTIQDQATSAQDGQMSEMSTIQDQATSAKDEQTSGDTSPPTIGFPPVLPPLPLTEDFNCQPIAAMLTEQSGVIAVTETQEDCNESWTWDIHLPSLDDGIVLQFHDVFMRSYCSLRVSSGMTTHREFTSSERDTFAPLLLKENQVRIVLETPYDSYKYKMSAVNITYAAHPKSRMPMGLSGAPVSNSRTMYVCSGNVLIPSAFRCNMVQQCLGGEDESDCEYQKQGCASDWFPFRDQCFKMTFVVSYAWIPGHSHPTFPSTAEETCLSKYEASLALLMDNEGVHFMGNVLRQTGFYSAAVGIKKVKPVSKKQRHLYRYLWQWGKKGSPIDYDQQELQRTGPLFDCAMLVTYRGIHLRPLRCVQPDIKPTGYICMKPNPSYPKVSVPKSLGVHLPRAHRLLDKIPTKECPDGSLVQVFHSCRWTGEASIGSSPNNLPMFPCRYGPPVHYSLLCDGKDDCADGSDEMSCRAARFPPLQESKFVCENLQLIPKSQQCDGKTDCFDETDEDDCTSCGGDQVMCTGIGCLPYEYAEFFDSCPTVPLIYVPLSYYYTSAVYLDGYGMSALVDASGSDIEGMFQCIGGNLIPSYLLNNGEQDCTLGEDENIPDDNFTCPGFYRCQYSGHCVHPSFVCDGIYQCPYKDDEMYCNVLCPEECVCEGYAFTCRDFIDPVNYSEVRYLDLSHSPNLSLEGIHFIEFMQFLNLSHCRLTNVSLIDMPQLLILDLSFNNLTNLSSFVFGGLDGLRHLNVSGNPFVEILDSSFSTFMKLSGLTGLQYLTMEHTDVRVIEDRAFSPLTELESLDIQNNQIESYDKEILYGLGNLKQLFTDDSKLCCSYFHPSLTQCLAPVDELSSCNDLLRENFFRLFLWLFSVLAITGNAGVLLYRAFGKKQLTSVSFRVLVSNLCGADFLMGIYMMIIGIADLQFRGVYIAKENAWKRSWACKIAGFLGFVSSEVSAMVICLITLDRLFVLCFPLKSHLRLNARSSMVACSILWFLGITLASLPFVANLEFYGETSICLPLPITRRRFSGQAYAFGVFIVLNFVLFVLIGMSQLLIFWTIRKARRAADSKKRPQEMAIARRLFLVVFTDFLCWFPVGLMGLLAAIGVPIPGVVNVWAAIFVLPLNSALNPFLYTLNSVLEKRKKEKQKTRAKKILGNIQAELPRLQPSMAEEVVRVCIRSKVVKKEKMLGWLQLRQDSTKGMSESELSTENTSSFVLGETTSAQVSGEKK